MCEIPIKKTVSEIADTRLCCSCGACAWVCPQKAISYVETVGGYLLPAIDWTACTGCGKCLSICPGAGIAPAVLEQLPPDPFVGNASKCYIGRATDQELYVNSQSGGITSALLANALQTGEIAAAVTTVMVEGNPPRAIAKIARNVEDIKKAQKSKYCPVHLLSILGEVERIQGSIALVGLPCQTHGLLNIIESYPQIKNKIRFMLGLVCAGTMTNGALDYLVAKASLPTQASKILHFRDKACGGYPGNVNVISCDGNSVSLSKQFRLRIRDFFTPARCRLCFDKMNVLGDITVGDPWGILDVDKSHGESMAVVRTEAGRQIFKSTVDNCAITVREIDYQQVVTGQRIDRKRMEWQGYIEAWRSLARPLPNFWEKVSDSSARSSRNGRYRSNLQQALSLDKYLSRKDVIAAAEKRLLFQDIKRKINLPLRTVKRAAKRLTGNCA